MEFPMILSDFPTPSDKLSRQTKVTWGTCFFSMAISGTQFLDSLDQYIVSIGIWVHS